MENFEEKTSCRSESRMKETREAEYGDDEKDMESGLLRPIQASRILAREGSIQSNPVQTVFFTKKSKKIQRG